MEKIKAYSAKSKGSKWLRRTIASVIFVASLAGAESQNTRNNQDKIKVGVIAGYTGDWALYGIAFQRGIEIAKEYTKEIKFIYEDDQFVPSKTVRAFNKLIDIDNVSAIIVGDTVTAQAIAQQAKMKKIPTLVWASSNNLFNDNPYILRLWSDLNKDFGKYSNEIKKLNYKKLALYASIHTYANTWAEALNEKFPESSVEIFTTDPQSFKSQILRLKKSQFDAVGICLNPGMNGLFARELRQLKNNLPLFGCNFVEATVDIKAAGESFNDIWFYAPKVKSEFINKVLKISGTTDHFISSAIMHDAAIILSSFFKKKLPRDSFPENLTNLDLNNETAISSLKIVKNKGDQFTDFDFIRLGFNNGRIIEQLED
jgi:ABC-type branched-subunit amino acid transport system substrate-binding protein